MKKWLTDNNAAIALDGLVAPLMISSWAIVVDVTWKNAFTNVRTTNPISDALTATGTINNGNYQAVGSTGDTIAVYINVAN